MAIDAGMMHDPEELQGLAHFHEHMLFLGTERYPDEAEYSQYLRGHGGFSNAFTSLENTAFFFSVDGDFLPGALDRFAQFFVAPLLAEESVERELHAVDSEHAMHRQQDSRRLFSLIRSLGDSDHPFHKFGTGNLETLRSQPERGVDLLASLRAFNRRHYTGDRMVLCVAGPNELDVLQSLAARYFARVPPDEGVVDEGPAAVEPSTLSSPFGPAQRGRWLHMVPVRDVRSLVILFPSPWPLGPRFRSKPHRVVSHILGHEARGSLAHFLQNEKRFATSLQAGPSISQHGFAALGLSIELSQTGLENIADVIDATFEYIALLRTSAEAYLREKHAEDAQLAEIAFLFAEPDEPASVVSDMALTLLDWRRYGADERTVLSGPALVSDDMDLPAVRELAESLAPENAIVIAIAPEDALDDTAGIGGDAGAWREDRWFGTQFREGRIADEHLHRWRPSSDRMYEALSLPPPNCFIPSDLSLRSETDTGREETTTRLTSAAKKVSPPQRTPTTASRAISLWHKLDSTFNVPKASVLIDVRIAGMYSSGPEQFALRRLWMAMLQDELNEELYMASSAGLHAGLAVSASGLSIQLSGWSEKLPLVLRHVTRRLSRASRSVLAGGARGADGDGEAAICGIFPGDAPAGVEERETLALIKPDATGDVDAIVSLIEQRGFAVVARKERVLSAGEARQFYAEHDGRSFFEALIALMTSGPTVALRLRHDGDAIREWRSLMGPTNTQVARANEPDSVRAKYGTDGTRNACHGSDSAESAARELAFWFEDASTAAHLEAVRSKQLQTHRNFLKGSPYRLAGYYVAHTLLRQHWSVDQYIAYLERDDFGGLAALASAVVPLFNNEDESATIQMLTHGNLLRDEAVVLADAFAFALSKTNTTTTAEVQHQQRPLFQHEQVLKLPRGLTVFSTPNRNEADDNSAVELHFQIGAAGGADLVSKMALEALNQVASADAFHELRTVEQLGYIVSTAVRRFGGGEGVLGWSVVVQSSHTGPRRLQLRVQAWMAKFREVLVNIPEREVAQTCTSLAQLRLEPSRKLRQETARHWGEIGAGTFDFDRVEKEAAVLREGAIDRARLLRLWDSHIAEGALERRGLAVHIFSVVGDHAADDRPDDDGGAALTSEDGLQKFKGACDDILLVE